MVRTIYNPTRPEDHAALRRELLRLILKRETERRDQRKVPQK